MTKAQAEQFAATISKYSLAIGCMLHPSQVDALQYALDYWREYEKLPNIDDAFVKLAFLMIISDLIYQEKERKAKTND